MAKYMMALDAGTTSNRCILFNEKGEICSVAQEEFTQYYPQPGWVEHDAKEIWHTQLSVARQAMEKLGVTAADIAGIGLLTSVKQLSFGIEKQECQSIMQSFGSAVVHLNTAIP